MESGLILTFVKMTHDEDSNVRRRISWLLKFATASHNLAMIKEIVANDSVAAICSLLSSENGPNTQIMALCALENIIRTVEIKEAKDVIISIANNTDNEEMSEKAFDIWND